MNEIFISYAAEDRQQAQQLAAALAARGWDVWWDREIPLGQSFDEVIEKAIAQAKCVIVLWSAVSVGSEWVRNEASEGKRRGILIPVFIEPVEAPLAFRLLNGADLSDWRGDSSNAEFARLVERVGELLTVAGNTLPVGGSSLLHARPSRDVKENAAKRGFTPLVVGILAVAVVGAGIAGYLLRGGESPPPQPQELETASKAAGAAEGNNDMEKSINNLVGALGSAIPATSLARGFHVPDLGVRIAFLTAEQSASTLGAMPAGAVVMEVESGKPIARAGIHVGDIVLSIAGKKILSEDDLRQAIFKIGPGKTQYSYRRGSDVKTVSIDCPACTVE
ncbi:MAG: TIR domain-containing protein [Chloroflexota bacterium]